MYMGIEKALVRVKCPVHHRDMQMQDSMSIELHIMGRTAWLDSVMLFPCKVPISSDFKSWDETLLYSPRLPLKSSWYLASGR